MASNFAFFPQTPTTYFTVGASTITFTMTLPYAAGTSTISVSSGIYQPSGVRVSNSGTANIRIMFTTSGTSAYTLTTDTGMDLFAATIETFRVQGLPVCKMLCPDGTSTIGITCGEGL